MAEERFRRLRKAGMGAVLVSVSPFHQESIPLQRGDVRRLAGILLDEGSFGLYQFAVDEVGYQPPEAGFTGKCHLCVDVRRHLFSAGWFEGELKPAKFYETLTE